MSRAMTTNITQAHREAFEALRDCSCDNFALFSCFANGEPAVAIVAIHEDDSTFKIRPLFISVTPGMTLTDHDGNPTAKEGSR